MQASIKLMPLFENGVMTTVRQTTYFIIGESFGQHARYVELKGNECLTAFLNLATPDTRDIGPFELEEIAYGRCDSTLWAIDVLAGLNDIMTIRLDGSTKEFLPIRLLKELSALVESSAEPAITLRHNVDIMKDGASAMIVQTGDLLASLALELGIAKTTPNVLHEYPKW